MEDSHIINLYFERNERAIKETDIKYGAFCKYISLNIIGILEEAEECVNDSYLAVWNKIPPTIPESFKAFLGRITRNIAISRFRSMKAKKRYSNMEILLSELNECVPAKVSTEELIELKELTGYICDWLDSLSEEDKVIFVRRYWFGETIQSLAKKCGISSSKMAQRMYHLRNSLKKALEKKGVVL